MSDSVIRHSRGVPAAFLIAAALVMPSMSTIASAHGKQKEEQPTATVYAEGLNNPRGLKFGPDGYLYVAEGGVGGDTPPPDPSNPDCSTPDAVGPYLGSTTGSRISRIDSHGNVTTYLDGLPSSQTNESLGSLVSGVADIAWVGHQMYAILAGAGCSHGVPSIPNAVIRVHHSDNSWDIVADLGAFQRANPVAQPEEEDFEPDGTWYSMISVRGALYAVEPNHGEIDRITPDGRIRRVIDVSASQGHVVPTVIAYRGVFYLSNLESFPQDTGASSIWKVTPNGHIWKYAGGFNMVLGIALDREGRVYVLQSSEAPAPTPGTGSIVRLSNHGKTRDVIASGLFLPGGMTMGPDGNLYVSNVSFGPPPVGLGQILKIDLHDDHHHH